MTMSAFDQRRTWAGIFRRGARLTYAGNKMILRQPNGCGATCNWYQGFIFSKKMEMFMSKEVDTLRAGLDAFSRQLDAKIREFKATGELESKETIEILRKRQEALKTKLDRAIRAGAVSDMLKLERKRDFEGLLDELRRMEKEFNAATVTGATKQRNGA